MSLPVLWHIPVSHYDEKVRWALDPKGVEHERPPPPPPAPAHMAVAQWKKTSSAQVGGRRPERGQRVRTKMHAKASLCAAAARAVAALGLPWPYPW